jgi:hypothetical protein
MNWVVSQCRLHGQFPHFRKTREIAASYERGYWSPWRLLKANRLVCVVSLQSRFSHIRNFLAETRFASAETGSIFLLVDAKQTIAPTSTAK